MILLAEQGSFSLEEPELDYCRSIYELVTSQIKEFNCSENNYPEKYNDFSYSQNIAFLLNVQTSEGQVFELYQKIAQVANPVFTYFNALASLNLPKEQDTIKLLFSLISVMKLINGTDIIPDEDNEMHQINRPVLNHQCESWKKTFYNFGPWFYYTGAFSTGIIFIMKAAPSQQDC